ncbi:6287_t:CDS:10, partial [Entrophospora sp. SA101]
MSRYRGACPQCKTRTWYPDAIGGMICKFGHQLVNFQVQVGDLSGIGRITRSRRQKKGKSSSSGGMKFARNDPKEKIKLILLAFQYSLRLQLDALINKMGFPPELEHVVRQLWTLYVNKHKAIETIKNLSRNNTYELGNLSEEEFRELYELKAINLLIILYLGMAWLRLPVTLWVLSKELPYLNIRKDLPDSIKLHLGLSRLKTFEPSDLVPCSTLHKLEYSFTQVYKLHYGIIFPEINMPLILYQYIRDLVLPVEFYVITKELGQLLNINLYPDQTFQSNRPVVILMALLVIVIKIVYGLDDESRIPNKYDKFMYYLPTFDQWVKKLGEVQQNLSDNRIPWEYTDLKEWINKSPDTYVKYCDDFFQEKNRFAPKPLNSKIERLRKRERDLEGNNSDDIDNEDEKETQESLQDKFKRFKIFQRIKSRIGKLEKELNDSVSYKGENDEETPNKDDLLLIDITEIKEMIINSNVNLESFYINTDEPTIVNIEDHLQELFFCVKPPSSLLASSLNEDRKGKKAVYNTKSDDDKADGNSNHYSDINSSRDHGIGMSKNPGIQDLFSRYSTFSYKKYKQDNRNIDNYNTNHIYLSDEEDHFIINKYSDNNHKRIGQDYKTYQVYEIYRDRLKLKKSELAGEYHEDYERVLLFCSNIVGVNMKTLQKNPDTFPKLQVDKGAIKFILSGANIMCPGLTSKGARIDEELPAEAIVSIFAEGKEHALAVGLTKKSTED